MDDRDAEGGDVVRRNLRVAAANGDDRAGVLALDAADGLPGLAPALGGHGAGVDDDDVRALALPRRDHAAGFQHRLECLCFKLVYLAAKGLDLVFHVFTL